ncbi:MAG: MATE family efflux transporter [Lachnospiraceae bacterium]
MQQEQSISNQNLSDSQLSRFGFHSKKPSDSAFYKAFFSMYPLLVLQNVVTLSVNLADNMMLGAYGESALSGAAAVNQIQFVYQCLLTALGDGLVMFGSQYWGKSSFPRCRSPHPPCTSGFCFLQFYSCWSAFSRYRRWISRRIPPSSNRAHSI